MGFNSVALLILEIQKHYISVMKFVLNSCFRNTGVGKKEKKNQTSNCFCKTRNGKKIAPQKCIFYGKDWFCVYIWKDVLKIYWHMKAPCLEFIQIKEATLCGFAIAIN